MDNLKQIFAGRPLYMNALIAFCAYMTFIYMPFDIFLKPVDQDEEVWFGYMLHGWAAKATAPIHWVIYGAGFYGFLKMKTWMFPWAALYVFQVAIAMVVWGWLYGDAPLYISVLIGIPFAVLGLFLWRAKPQFNGLAADTVVAETAEPSAAAENSAAAEKSAAAGKKESTTESEGKD